MSLSRGSCVGHPEPEIWFSSSAPNLRRAKEVCGSCAVRRLCLEMAGDWGTWGGVFFRNGEAAA